MLACAAVGAGAAYLRQSAERSCSAGADHGILAHACSHEVQPSAGPGGSLQRVPGVLPAQPLGAQACLADPDGHRRWAGPPSFRVIHNKEGPCCFPAYPAEGIHKRTGVVTVLPCFCCVTAHLSGHQHLHSASSPPPLHSFAHEDQSSMAILRNPFVLALVDVRLGWGPAMG